MKASNFNYFLIPGLYNISNHGERPNQPQRNDPFRKEEDDNDATRIRPGVHEPEKNDPTKIDIPNMPTPPSPDEEQFNRRRKTA